MKYRKTNQTTQSTPSICEFKGKLYFAFRSNDRSNKLFVISSNDGINWSSHIETRQTTGAGPAICVYNNQLYIAFRSNDSSHRLLIISSTDGKNWSSNTNTGQTTTSAPAICKFKNKLYLAFKSNNSSNKLLIISSDNGTSWSSHTDTKQSTGTSPGISEFQGQLYIAFKSNNSSHKILTISSNDGINWSSNKDTGQSTESSPAICKFNGQLYIAFKSNNSSNNILTINSNNGTTWSSNTDTGETSRTGPSLCEYDNLMCLAFQSNNKSNYLLYKMFYRNLAAGWDIINANQKSVINQKIKALYDTNKLPTEFKGVKLGCPEITGGDTSNSKILDLKFSLNGTIGKKIEINGDCICKVNLNALEGSIKDSKNTDDTSDTSSYILSIDISGNLFESIKFSKAKTLLNDQLEKEVLKFLNNIFQNIEPIEIPFNLAIPISLNDTTIKFAFVENNEDPNLSFLTILAGINGNIGTYKLSKDIISNPANCNSSIVLSNWLIMYFIKNILTDVLSDDIYKGNNFLELSRLGEYYVLKSNEDSKEFPQKKGVIVKIDKGGLTSQFVSGNYFNSSLEIEVDIRYSSIWRAYPWGTLPVTLTINFLEKDNQLELDFFAKMGENKGGLSCVTSEVKEKVGKIANKLNGEPLIPIRNFNVKQVFSPSYIQISGQLDS